MTSGRVPALFLVSALLGVGGCSSVSCTAIGASSGVVVTISGIDAKTAVIVEVCVRKICTKVAPPARAVMQPVFVTDRGVNSESPIEITVAVSRADGVSIVPVRGIVVRPKKDQPNGPECEPTVYVARIAVDAAENANPDRMIGPT